MGANRLVSIGQQARRLGVQQSAVKNRLGEIGHLLLLCIAKFMVISTFPSTLPSECPKVTDGYDGEPSEQAG